MATLHGDVRNSTTLLKGDAYITISPIEATDSTNNSQYSVSYGSEFRAPVSFVADMQGWQFNHSNFEHIADTFEQVSVLPGFMQEIAHAAQPALVAGMEWLYFTLTHPNANHSVLVTLFACPVQQDDCYQNQYSLFLMSVSPQAAMAFGKALRKEIKEARAIRIALGIATQEDYESVASPGAI